MDVKALSYYVAIADQKSINKAAEILYISQPVLSRTVQALDHDGDETHHRQERI